MKIEVVAYRKEWAAQFISERERLKAALPIVFLQIFHIGSTSVKGLAAKPIIDLLLVVDNLQDLDDHRVIFEQLGYEVCGEFGIPGRRYYRKGGDQRTHQIHAFAYNNLYEIERHLAVRDYLRTHTDAVARYATVKRAAAEFSGNDIEKYGDFKETFVKQLEEAAIKWRLQIKANNEGHQL